MRHYLLKFNDESDNFQYVCHKYVGFKKKDTKMSATIISGLQKFTFDTNPRTILVNRADVAFRINRTAGILTKRDKT